VIFINEILISFFQKIGGQQASPTDFVVGILLFKGSFLTNSSPPANQGR
jgi:hypothetical protein